MSILLLFDISVRRFSIEQETYRAHNYYWNNVEEYNNPANDPEYDRLSLTVIACETAFAQEISWIDCLQKYWSFRNERERSLSSVDIFRSHENWTILSHGYITIDLSYKFS